MPIEVTPNRNPLDIGSVYGETHRQDDSKTQENKGRIRGPALRERGSQTVQGAQVRDCSGGQEGLIPSLQFVKGESLPSGKRNLVSRLTMPILGGRMNQVSDVFQCPI